MELSWKAGSYHEWERDNELQFVQTQPEHELSFAQMKYHKPAFGGQDLKFQTALAEARKYINEDDIDLALLPKDFRWDDFMGYDWTADIKD